MGSAALRPGDSGASKETIGRLDEPHVLAAYTFTGQMKRSTTILESTCE
jgi:hypothetical protein